MSDSQSHYDTLKVLYVHHGGVIGGAPVSLSLLVSHVVKNSGVDASIACHSAVMRDFLQRRTGVAVIEWPDTITQIAKLLIGWSSISSMALLKAFLGNLKKFGPSISEQAELLQQHKPDIVHLNSSVLLSTAIAAHKVGIPIVWHVREAFHGLSWDPARVVYGRLLQRLASAVVCISPVEVRRMKGQRRPKVHVVYNPVDLETLDARRFDVAAVRNKLGLDSARPVVLTLGGVASRKGAVEIVKAAGYMGDSVQLVFAGPPLRRQRKDSRLRVWHRVEDVLMSFGMKRAYSWDYETRFAATAATMVGRDIRFVGHVEDVASWIAACDVLVFAGTVPHFPRPVYEAWAMKKPVVAFDVDGVAQNIEDGVDGVLVPPRSGEALGKSIRDLLAHPYLMSKMGRAGYRKTLERCDPRHGSEQVLAIYRKITGTTLPRMAAPQVAEASRSAGRTIVLLSHKRSGTTALFRVFQKHPDVGVCHVNQAIRIWEPNFWNLAAKAMGGDPRKFIERFRNSHPFLRLPERFTRSEIFRMWDDILERLGPVVFDKSPQYLGNREALDLLMEYRERGNDVRMFAMVRDPRDTIASQFETLGRGRYEGYEKGPRDAMYKRFLHLSQDCPPARERHWLEKHRHLEDLLRNGEDIPVFRYEDLSAAPVCYIPMMFKHCGVRNIDCTYSEMRPVHVGRYENSAHPEIRNWDLSLEMKAVLKRYGYLDVSTAG